MNSLIETKIQPFIESQDILGLSIAIVRGGEIVYANGFGMTSVEAETALPVTQNTIFSLGITSRTLTTVMVLRLVEQGHLNLDRPIVEYLHGYVFHNNPEWGQRITLRHLLSETVGSGSGGKGWGPNDPNALERWCWNEYAHYQFLAEPGKMPNHGNHPAMAAYLAEVVTGKHFPLLMQELVFEPLQMTRSTYDRDVAMTYAVALDHEKDKNGNLRVKHRYLDNPVGNPDFFALSSAHDLANFTSMLLNQGQFNDEQILSPESVQMMSTSHASYGVSTSSDVRTRMEEGEGFGGIVGQYKGVPYFGRPAFHGQIINLDLFPSKGLGVILLTNYADSDKRTELLYSIYDDLLETPSNFHYPAPSPTSDDSHKALWPKHVGRYLMEWGEEVKIWVEDDQLFIEYEETPYPLTAISPYAYTFIDQNQSRQSLTFIPIEDGPTNNLQASFFACFRYDPEPDFTPNPTEWQKWQGTYINYQDAYSTVGYHIYMEGNSLYVTGPDDAGKLQIPEAAEGTICTPVGPTKIIYASGMFDFFEDESGQKWLQKDMGFRYRRIADFKGTGWKINEDIR
ncbi:MAG: serine hydrolase domain-containing protein [Chloroflexota bacterium]